jgi:hypothetical protein
MTELNGRRRCLAAMHLAGCVVSLLVMLALPTLRFHHFRTAFGNQEIEREAARQSFVAPCDSTPLTQIAQTLQRVRFSGALTLNDDQRPTHASRVAIVVPIAQILVRLKLPPPSRDPFHAALA